MSATPISICSTPTSPTSAVASSRKNRAGSLRERCGFTLFISFAPLHKTTPGAAAEPKGELGPTMANLPRRKRSSVSSIEVPAAPAPSRDGVGEAEAF
ncbi:hypothetical protein R3P38DRAFT_1189913 [Favolaschia claudopus]|uniref:Uncharacterized protein n=1 Tax=Favolaschia claudopus TaxID=2862362 RepID=A0AAW0DYJ0_9AGAR